MKLDFLVRCCGSYSSFRDYGEAVLKHLENITESDPKLQKTPVNYEGVSSLAFKSTWLIQYFQIQNLSFFKYITNLFFSFVIGM